MGLDKDPAYWRKQAAENAKWVSNVLWTGVALSIVPTVFDEEQSSDSSTEGKAD